MTILDAAKDAELERAVIGAVLVDPTTFVAVSVEVTADDFTDPCAAAAFGVMLELHGRGEPIDTLLVAHHARERHDWWDRKADAELVGCIATAPFSGNAASYARIVFDLAERRRMAVRLSEVQRQLLAEEITLAEATGMIGRSR